MGEMADYYLDYAFDPDVEEIDGYQGSAVADRAASGVWRSRDGSEMRVVDMTDSHLLNAKRMMDKGDWETPYHPVLLAEIRRRELVYP